jgi:hypothetical protein
MFSLQLDEDVDDVLNATAPEILPVVDVGLQPQCNHYEMLLQFPSNGARKLILVTLSYIVNTLGVQA